VQIIIGVIMVSEKLQVLKEHYKQCYQNFQYADAENVRKATIELKVAKQILSQEIKRIKNKGVN
jgi:hypothetical protein